MRLPGRGRLALGFARVARSLVGQGGGGLRRHIDLAGDLRFRVRWCLLGGRLRCEQRCDLRVVEAELLADLVGRQVDIFRQRRQVRGAFQAEVLEEALRGAEQARPAGRWGTARLMDQPSRAERRYRAVAVDASYGVDAAACHWLPVGDDRQRLQRGVRQLARGFEAEEVLDVLGGIGVADQLDAIGALLQTRASTLVAQRSAEAVERRSQLPALDCERQREGRLVHRMIGDEEQRLQAARQLVEVRRRRRVPDAASLLGGGRWRLGIAHGGGETGRQFLFRGRLLDGVRDGALGQLLREIGGRLVGLDRLLGERRGVAVARGWFRLVVELPRELPALDHGHLRCAVARILPRHGRGRIAPRLSTAVAVTISGMIVDIHTHIFPPAMIERRAELASIEPRFAELYADPQARMATVEDLVRSMDAAAVDASVAAGFWWSSGALAEEHTAYLLDAAGAHPGHILPFVPSLAAPEGAAGIGEVRETDPAALGGAGGPLLVHCSEEVGHAYPGKTGGLTPGDLWRLVQSRAGDDAASPVVAAHWGGGFAFYGLMPEVRAAVDGGRLLFDTAASAYLYDASVFRVALDLVGPSAIAWGSDFPLREQSRDLGEARAALAEASEVDRDAVLGGNAAQLLGL